MKSYRIVWFGNTGFSKISLLRVIEDGHKVVAICSCSGSPLIEVSKKFDIPMYEVKDPGDPGFALTLLGYQADFFVVCAFLILPEEIINIPRLGCIGIYPSLLPKFRGVAPIEAFLQSGDSSTGVTTFLMSKEVNKGDVLDQESWMFDPVNDMFPAVHDVLASGASGLISKTLMLFEATTPIPQSDFKYVLDSAPRITKNSRRVRFSKCNPSDILGKMRAFSDNGGIWTTIMETSTEVIIHEGFFDIIDSTRIRGCYVGGLYYEASSRDYFIPVSSQDEPVVLRPIKIQTDGQRIMYVKDWRSEIKMNNVRFD